MRPGCGWPAEFNRDVAPLKESVAMAKDKEGVGGEEGEGAHGKHPSQESLEETDWRGGACPGHVTVFSRQRGDSPSPGDANDGRNS